MGYSDLSGFSQTVVLTRSLEPSHVLLALGLKPEEVHGSLRLSLGKYNTLEDIDYVLEVLPRTVEKLRKMSPLLKLTVNKDRTHNLNDR